MRLDRGSKLVDCGADRLLVADVGVDPLPGDRHGVDRDVELHLQVPGPGLGPGALDFVKRGGHRELGHLPVDDQGADDGERDEVVEETPRLDARHVRLHGARRDAHAALGVANLTRERLDRGL